MARADFLPIRGWDHLEFYVGNAKQAAHFYDKTFGFRPVARRGLETGLRDRSSYVMQQGNIRLVFSSALTPDHAISRHHALHGDSVRAIALDVTDIERTLRETQARGATLAEPLTRQADEHGEYLSGAIRYAGDTVLRFVQRAGYRGPFAPGYAPIAAHGAEPVGLAAIDHVVTNVYLGEMNYWVRWFEQVMGFSQLCAFTDEDIHTEYSALMSKVVENGTGRIKLPINEPAEGRKRSQIEEYLEWHCGPGVQHIAMNTRDICATVRELRRRDIDFLRVPDTYYDDLAARVGDIPEDLDELRELGVLVDRDEDGYLLQVFSQPVQDRPTLFYEVIERHGNFKALFVSLEREQARRGNL